MHDDLPSHTKKKTSVLQVYSVKFMEAEIEVNVKNKWHLDCLKDLMVSFQ